MHTKRITLALAVSLALCAHAFAFETLTPKDVQQGISAGDTVLIDIRRPDEWAATGIAASAIPLDMRESSFSTQIKAIAAANPTKKIALICHSDVRSKWLASKLEGIGIKNIVDVAGGMAGNSENPGWLALSLPVRKP